MKKVKTSEFLMKKAEQYGLTVKSEIVPDNGDGNYKINRFYDGFLYDFEALAHDQEVINRGYVKSNEYDAALYVL